MKSKLYLVLTIISLSINICACNVNANVLTKSENSETIENGNNVLAQSELTTSLKKLLEKKAIKSLLSDKTISEVFKEGINNGSLKSLSEMLNNILPEIKMSVENFKTDEDTYNWLSNVITKVLKATLNKGDITEADIDSINQAIGILGVNKISLPKKTGDFDDKDAEKFALQFVPILEKVLDPTILKLLGIDLEDPKLFENLMKQISNS